MVEHKKKKKYVSKYKDYVSTYKENEIYKPPPYNLKLLSMEKKILEKRYGELCLERLKNKLGHIPYNIRVLENKELYK